MKGAKKVKGILFGILIIIPFLLTSCFLVEDEDQNKTCKNNCTTIQGRFTTEDGSIGIGNIPLELEWENIGMLNGTTRKIATTTSNDNGFYTFVFEAKEHELTKGEFKITFDINQKEFIKPVYQYFSFHNIPTKDTTIIYNYHLPKSAYIQLKAINPVDFIDAEVAYINASFNHDNPDLQNKQSSGDTDLKNTASNDKIILVAGNQPSIIRIFKKKNGVATVKNDTILVPVNDTIDYKVSL